MVPKGIFNSSLASCCVIPSKNRAFKTTGPDHTVEIINNILSGEYKHG